LGISVRVDHNAEAELRRLGFIERTYNPHARRTGKRRGNDIVALAGISLRLLIDDYPKWQARLEAIEMRNQTEAILRHAVAQLNRQIRQRAVAGVIEKAGQILPGGRISKVTNIARLEAIKSDLEALLEFTDLPSGDTKSSDQTEEIVSLNILEKDSSENRMPDACDPKRAEPADVVTPAMAARVASAEYQCLLPSARKPDWNDIVQASATACRWHGISQPAWGEACKHMGRRLAAVCVLVIDRNARLPLEHRYRGRLPKACLAGMVKKHRQRHFDPQPLLRAIQGFEDDAMRSAANPLPEREQPSLPGVTSAGALAQQLLHQVTCKFTGEFL
jgi:hypothetical protein